MKKAGAAVLVALVLNCACGGGNDEHATKPAQPFLRNLGTDARDAGGSEPRATCPTTIDVPGLLARNGESFGSAAQVSSELPLSIRGTIDHGDSSAPHEMVLNSAAIRVAAVVGGLYVAEGLDTQGTWIMPISGVVERTKDEEGIDPRLELWLALRGYQDDFDLHRDNATCEIIANGPRYTLSYARPDLGSPMLAIDGKTGALLSVTHSTPEGRRTETDYDEWRAPDSAHVRWPAKTTEKDPVTNGESATYDAPTPGIVCQGATDAACFSPPRSQMQISWPAAGVVHVPMLLTQGEISLRAHVGKRDVWALLDSGAGLTTVDAMLPAANMFHASSTIDGTSATQRITLGIGTLESVSVGGLEVLQMPTVSVPLHVLEVFGDRRPEVVLGFTLFQAGFVRVDYKKSEIVFSKTQGDLVAKTAQVMPIRELGGKIVVAAEFEGHPATFEVDTGSSGAFDPYKSWATSSGVLAAHRTTSVTGYYSAGDSKTEQIDFRFATASLGPLTVTDSVAHVGDPPGTGIIAGLVGNEALARCSAVTFDVLERKMWIEPPCDRKRPESLAGWRLAPAPGDDKHPWLIQSMHPGGSAERAGFHLNDRIVDIAGIPATMDRTKFEAVDERPVGTKVPVTFVRDGKTMHATMELVRAVE